MDIPNTKDVSIKNKEVCKKIKVMEDKGKHEKRLVPYGKNEKSC